MHFTSKRLVLVFLVTLVWLVLPHAVLADDGGDYYFRFAAITDDIGGDFDGARGYLYQDGDVTIPVPLLDQANGYKITFGTIENRLAGEFNFSQSNHETFFDNSLFGTSYDLGDRIHQRLGFDARYFFIPPQETGLAPYCQLGIFLDRLLVEDGPPRIPTPVKATYRGYGFDLGVGVLWRMNNRLGFELSYLMSHLKVSKLSGLGRSGKPLDNFSATGQELNLGLNFYF